MDEISHNAESGYRSLASLSLLKSPDLALQ